MRRLVGSELIYKFRERSGEIELPVIELKDTELGDMTFRREALTKD